MPLKKPEKSSGDFWNEYEEKTGEKILKRGLGKYVSGWEEFDRNKWNGIWGLIVNTTGGFRFHHFPQKSWIDSFTAFANREQVKEKTIFIPKESISSTELIKEKKLIKRIFCHSVPHLVVHYLDETSQSEKKLVFEAEYRV